MSFVNVPFLPCVLNVTVILPFLPGMIGSLGHSGVVQPHEACAF